MMSTLAFSFFASSRASYRAVAAAAALAAATAFVLDSDASFAAVSRPMDVK